MVVSLLCLPVSSASGQPCVFLRGSAASSSLCEQHSRSTFRFWSTFEVSDPLASLWSLNDFLLCWVCCMMKLLYVIVFWCLLLLLLVYFEALPEKMAYCRKKWRFADKMAFCYVEFVAWWYCSMWLFFFLCLLHDVLPTKTHTDPCEAYRSVIRMDFLI